jgi:FkbM family methyltransferase
MLTDLVKRAGRLLGVEVSHYRPVARRRKRLLDQYEIGIVLDVGASRGQYALELRRFGYGGRIVSFEPVAASFAELAQAAAADTAWVCHRVALGESAGQARIGVATNLTSSSLLQILDAHVAAAPDVKIVSYETIPVRTLDSFELALGVPTLLKLDVQGYEHRVLAGATETLKTVSLLECELSIEPLYACQHTLLDMLERLEGAGFQLVSLDPGLHDATGRILQFEAMLGRLGLTEQLSGT